MNDSSITLRSLLTKIANQYKCKERHLKSGWSGGMVSLCVHRGSSQISAPGSQTHGVCLVGCNPEISTYVLVINTQH
jgi:hypothetical protein